MTTAGCRTGVTTPIEFRPSIPPGQTFRFSPNFILNIERFGGLLLERGGTPAWELDPHHAAFLKVLQRSGDWRLSLEAPRRIHGTHAFRPDLEALTAIGVLEPGAQPDTGPPETLEATIDAVAADVRAAQARIGLRAPTLLTIYPDLFCQQRCDFCYLTQSDKGPHSLSKSNHRPSDDWIALIREARDLGVAGISLLGGEPTLYPGLAEVILACQDLDITLGITSNGVRMPAEVFSAISRSEHTMFCFSLESMDADVHKRHTGVSNEHVLRRLKQFGDAGIPFNVNTIGMGQSLSDLRAVADTCAEYGARVWFLNMYYTKKHFAPGFPGYDWYAEMNEELGAYVTTTYGDRLTYQMFGCQLYWTYPASRLAPSASATRYNEMISGCAAGINQLEVLPDGVTLPCIQMDLDTYSCGNVFDSGLAEVWNNSPVLKRQREKLIPSNSACSGCAFSSKCRGGCPERQRINQAVKGEEVDHLCPRLPEDYREKVGL